MKNHSFFVLAVSALLLISFGCNPANNSSEVSSDCAVKTVDSLALQLHQLDSLYNSGSLIHIDIYQIGKLKSIEFSVQSISVEQTNIYFINLRKDCGNDYYYSWEDARILPAECPYLMKAIDIIKQNWKRETDHEERYAYITKDDIRLFASTDGGGAKWRTALSVDYRKDRSEITLNEEDMESFISYINMGLNKIAEISKKEY